MQKMSNASNYFSAKKINRSKKSQKSTAAEGLSNKSPQAVTALSFSYSNTCREQNLCALRLALTGS